MKIKVSVSFLGILCISSYREEDFDCDLDQITMTLSDWAEWPQKVLNVFWLSWIRDKIQHSDRVLEDMFVLI